MPVPSFSTMPNRATGAREHKPDRSRRALGVICYGENAREDTNAKAAYQAAPDIRLKDESKIR